MFSKNDERRLAAPFGSKYHNLVRLVRHSFWRVSSRRIGTIDRWFEKLTMVNNPFITVARERRDSPITP